MCLTLTWIALQIRDQTPHFLLFKGNRFNNSLLSGGKKSSPDLHLREGGSLSGGTPLPQPPFHSSTPTVSSPPLLFPVIPTKQAWHQRLCPAQLHAPVLLAPQPQGGGHQWQPPAEEGIKANKSRAISSWGGMTRQAASAKRFLITALFGCGRVAGKEVVKGKAVENAAVCASRGGLTQLSLNTYIAASCLPAHCNKAC